MKKEKQRWKFNSSFVQILKRKNDLENKLENLKTEVLLTVLVIDTVGSKGTMRHIRCWIAHSKAGRSCDWVPSSPANVAIIFFASDTNHIVLVLQVSRTCISSTSRCSVTSWVGSHNWKKASIRIPDLSKKSGSQLVYFLTSPVVPVKYCKHPGGPASSSCPQVYWVT